MGFGLSPVELCQCLGFFFWTWCFQAPRALGLGLFRASVVRV